MDGITLKVEGLKELQQKLDELPLKLARRILRRALGAAANVWKREMELRAPRIAQALYGAPEGYLAAHIGLRVSIRGDELSGTAAVGPTKDAYPLRIPKRGGRGSTVTVAMVARFLEFGTRKMAAKPFIRQSFEAKKDDALEQFIDGAKVGFNEAVK
jgi:HK97 gp10 family phage protein